MESILVSRSLGEESLQMWELNKRLEAYLARVKSLEEENGLLRSEIQTLRAGPSESLCWRAHYEEEVAALRATLDQAFREKHAAELAREALHDQVQQVHGQCQKERAAREEAKRLLAASKKELEEERRAQLWLREKAAQLEKEAEGLAEAHREEMAGLEREAAGFSHSLEGFRTVAPGCLQPQEVEDYAQRLSAIWQGAVETYKCGVSQAEASLSQAKEELRKAAQSNRQNQLQLQQLETELAGLRNHKEALEESLSRQSQLQQGEAEKLQLAVESLEEEKRSLQAQIAQVLEERQQLMHLKMSLSLEVATYRTLLEAESTRLQMPTTMMVATDLKLPSGLKDLRAEPQEVPLERVRLCFQDPRPSPTSFLKGSARPWSPRSPAEPSFAANPTPLLPKSRRPVAREFQKANTVLQAQSPKGFNMALTRGEAPAFADSATFTLGKSQQSQVIMATQTESVSQSFFQQSSPAFNSISPSVPNVLEESGSSVTEKGLKEGEDRGGTAADVEKLEGTEENKVSSEEVEEEEGKQPCDEPPEKTLYPSQLATEASKITIKDVSAKDVLPESSLFSMKETQNGFLSNDSCSTEEENEAASVPSRKELDATDELHKDWMGGDQEADWQEDVKGFEVSGEVNGGQEALVESQDEERGLWVSQEAGPPSPLETRLSEEEGIGEEIAIDAPVAGEREIYRETKSPEQNEGENGELLPTFQADEPEEVFECIASASQLGKEAHAKKESWDPATSYCEDPIGAMGGCLEETEGGAEDLEVVSIEALHLSEDEERRDLWSPSRENEEYDLQAGTPGSELRQAEGEFVAGNLSPLSHTDFLLEKCQEDLFVQVEQEKLEEPNASLCQTDSALPEEEPEEVLLEPESLGPEETLSWGHNSTRNEENTLLDKPRVMDSRGAQEEEGLLEGEDISRPRDLHEEESDLGKEDVVEKERFLETEDVGSPDSACEPEAILQPEEAENVLEEEVHAGGQTKETEEDFPQELQGEQKTEEEEIITASPESDGHTVEGAELPQGKEATEAESEEAEGTLEMEDIIGSSSPGHLEEKEEPSERPEDQQGKMETRGAADEQQIAVGKEEEAAQSQEYAALGHSTILDASQEAEAPSEVQSDTPPGPEAAGHADTSYPQPQSNSLESEESLESSDTSPNATYNGDEIKNELESGQQIVLEDSLPDHTPPHEHKAEMLATTGESQPLSEGKDAAKLPPLTTDSSEFVKEETQQVLKEESPRSPPPDESDKEHEGIKEEESCHTESGESPAAKDLEETDTGRPETLQENQDPHAAKPELSRVEESLAHCPEHLGTESETQAEGGSPQKGGNVETEPELVEEITEGETGTDFAWEPEKNQIFQADPFDSSSPEEGVSVEDDGSLELSGREKADSEGPHKESPLTSVADLGEIVLEGEGPLGSQAGEAESKDLECAETGPDDHDAHQIFELESRGRGDQAQEEEPSEFSPRSQVFPDPSPEVTVSTSIDTMKDADILEIVEQALEFNQERIKAAEQSDEVGLPSPGGDTRPSPEEKSLSASVASLDSGEPQIEKEVPVVVSSPKAKDPAHLWAENNTNGLQVDPSLADFTEEILNSLGPLRPRSTEGDASAPGKEQAKKVTIPQELLRGEMDDDLPTVEPISHNPPQALSTEEAPRAGEVGSETHEKTFPDHRGQEALDAQQSIFAEILQTARGKGGKEREPEEMPLTPDFGDEVLRPQSSQNLKFHPEEEDEPWSSEDN